MSNIIQWIVSLKCRIKGVEKGCDDYEMVYYKTSLIFYDGWKFLILFCVGYILNILPQLITLVASTFLIKRYSAGFHINNGYACLLIGLGSFLIPTYFLAGIKVPVYLMAIITIINTAILYKYASPATVNSPFGNALIKKKRCISASLALLMGLAAAIMNNKFSIMLLLSTSICAASVLPVLYRLFKNETLEDYKVSENQKNYINRFYEMEHMLNGMAFRIYIKIRSLLTEKCVYQGIVCLGLAFVLVIISSPDIALAAGNAITEVKAKCAEPYWWQQPTTPSRYRNQLKD